MGRGIITFADAGFPSLPESHIVEGNLIVLGEI